MAKARHRLKALREKRGFTQESLAHHLNVGTSTVRAWEQGISTPFPENRGAYAEALGIDDETLDANLNGNGLDLQRLVPGWFSFYTAVEQTATTVRIWETSIVPGLLQTEDYASALLHDPGLVHARLDRQDMVTRRDGPVEVLALIDESVLHRPIGSPEVFAKQLRHLVKMSRRENIEIRVFPLDAPEQPLWFGAFAILSFPWAVDGVAYLEHASDGVIVHSPDGIARHVKRWEAAMKLALPPVESINRINQNLEQLEQ